MPPIDRHPPPETLVAYHEQRLAEPEAEDLREHLATCRDCTAQLLSLADLLDGGGVPAAEEISRAELDAAWERQRERRLPPAPVAPVVPLAGRRAGFPPPPRPSWVTAASLGLAAALALVVIAQWRTIARLEQPRANPPLVNLAPAGSLRETRPATPELRLSEGTERAWVILNPTSEPDGSPYDVEVVTAGGEVVLRLRDLRSSEAGNFRLEIPRALLAPGDYKIRLLPTTGGRRRAGEEFELKVRPSTPASARMK